VIRNTNNECFTRHEHSGASCKHWKTSWISRLLKSAYVFQWSGLLTVAVLHT